MVTPDDFVEGARRPERSVQRFYDLLSDDYHLIFADWDASIARQADALGALVEDGLGASPRTILDCACGIGTQAIGLSGRGHRVVGTDLSRSATARAATEAAHRGRTLPVAAADMRALPFAPETFDVVVCADNSLPHLLSPREVSIALREMKRVLRPGGLLVISTRAYDEARRTHPTTTPPQVSTTDAGPVITFQLWDWHSDGEHYDLRHVQLVPVADTWDVRVRQTTYWALTRRQLTAFVAEAGFTALSWNEPPVTGFYQPVLTAHSP